MVIAETWSMNETDPPARGTRTLVIVLLTLAVVLAVPQPEQYHNFVDQQIVSLGGLVSGHTAKHLLAALAAWWVWRLLRLRRPAPDAGHPSCTRAS